VLRGSPLVLVANPGPLLRVWAGLMTHVSAPDRREVARAFGAILKIARTGAALSQHQLARKAYLSSKHTGTAGKRGTPTKPAHHHRLG
jgi:hypothetical protein